MKALKLASNLSLPVDVVTQAIAIIAKRRAGKSYTMRRLAEQLHHAGQQLVLVDPKGDQWGIRTSADGKRAGLPIVILGGERADVPIESTGGELVAKLVVEERVSALIDLSLFRKHEVATFMTGFLEALYRLKAREQFRTPMMLVIDEADAIAPQKPQKGEERMLGAAEDIVRRGGQRGIGCVLVTQRSAVLNKNVLTQCQIIVALRTIAPQDLAALNAWVEVHGTKEEQATLMQSLPSLPVGDAWFWSPGWPTTEGIFQRVHILPIETFDSGATPTGTKQRVEPKTVADIDLEAVKRQMADAIERKKADDPKELKRQIAELKKKAEFIHPGPIATGVSKAPPILTEHDRTLLADLGKAIRERTAKTSELMTAAESRCEHFVQSAVAEYLNTVRNVHTDVAADVAKTLERVGLQKILSKLEGVAIAAPGPVAQPRHRVTPPAPQRVAPRQVAADGNATVGNSGLRRMLIALAQRPQGLNRRQLGVRAGLSSRSGTFDTYLSRARTNGWITDGHGKLVITDDGLKALGSYTPLPEGAELLQHWLSELGTSGAARILAALASVYPRSLTRAELGEAAALSDRSGTFDTYLSRLRTLELIEGKGELKASDELF